jgi:predicted N-acetyltransferase YhbS
MPYVIEQARPQDAPAILALQQLCFQSEAALYGRAIPPLLQTLEDLAEECSSLRVLKLVLDGEIVGSVRAGMEDGVCRVGRLMVHPRLRHRGLGSLLMAQIERGFAAAERYEIFTGSRSVHNRSLPASRLP